jgi:hypothetical protein
MDCGTIAAMRSLRWAAAFTCLTATLASAAEPKDPLARARLLYNDRQFDAAVAAAEEGGHVPERADSADLIAARAYLERFRASAVPDDLTRARDRLSRINPGRLNARERTELIIGLGETLFFDDSSGAAAGVFESVLAGGDHLAADARERVLDWWASALDRDVRPRSDFERQAVYQKIRDRMQLEIGANPGSSAASYWLSAAAWGQGDHQAAWDAAQAGWVRAPMASDHGAALRGDLDRLVQRGIIPERAGALAQSPDNLQQEWDQFKERWKK